MEQKSQLLTLSQLVHLSSYGVFNRNAVEVDKSSFSAQDNRNTIYLFLNVPALFIGEMPSMMRDFKNIKNPPTTVSETEVRDLNMWAIDNNNEGKIEVRAILVLSSGVFENVYKNNPLIPELNVRVAGANIKFAYIGRYFKARGIFSYDLSVMDMMATIKLGASKVEHMRKFEDFPPSLRDKRDEIIPLVAHNKVVAIYRDLIHSNLDRIWQSSAGKVSEGKVSFKKGSGFFGEIMECKFEPSDEYIYILTEDDVFDPFARLAVERQIMNDLLKAYKQELSGDKYTNRLDIEIAYRILDETISNSKPRTNILFNAFDLIP